MRIKTTLTWDILKDLIKNKIFLITGASSGLGNSLLLHLSEKLLSNEKFNKFYADEYFQIIKNFKQSTFENFIEII